VSAEKFPGEVGATKKRPKNSKKDRKNSTIKPLPGGRGQRRKIAKKKRKIALLSLYVLYLYHEWKSRGGNDPPALSCRRQQVLAVLCLSEFGITLLLA